VESVRGEERRGNEKKKEGEVRREGREEQYQKALVPILR
jgi:HSP20 family molecular chaperone IbpA